jgi:hypothetical protein
MNYLIVIFVLLLVIAPIISILPSKRQKQQMNFRQEARALGVNVALVKIDDPDSDKEKYLSATGRPLPRELDCIAYRKPRRRNDQLMGAKIPDWALFRDKSTDDQLRWVDGPPASMDTNLRAEIEHRANNLPTDVVRIDEIAQLVTIYWHERSDELGLANIFDFLKVIVALSPCSEKDSSSDSYSVDD